MHFMAVRGILYVWKSGPNAVMHFQTTTGDMMEALTQRGGEEGPLVG